MPLTQPLTRAAFLQFAGAALLSGPVAAQTGARMQRRKIPATGEELPVIGCGTWQTFDVGASSGERAPLAEVLRVLFDAGGTAIDSSPMYGRAEGVVGDLLAASGDRNKAFLATKVWTSGRQAGIDQMQRSMNLLCTDRIDLMQIHNLVDWQTHLPTLQAWKKEGRVRLIGVTHYAESAHDTVLTVLQRAKFDFLQINYAIDDRGAERRLLPFARDNGIAVMINQPFGGGGLLRKLAGRKLPSWAGEIGCTSWAQILLKFVLAHPAVTCAIPGTSKPEHMRDNAQAGLGAFPDAALLKRMTAEIAA
ncbi:MAG: aldo/keto reductase [Alphaproteobacteria bacterium]|nr:aldo/keto reductase [Alphaproteobacteria bacterium]